jgi:hypothetical protein
VQGECASIWPPSEAVHDHGLTPCATREEQHPLIGMTAHADSGR